jgi:hypothetical protein
MGIHANTDWEFRTSGNNDNGGGFYDRVPATSVDYSQQDAAQLTLTDLTTDVAGTTLSSVTGGFTAAMQGNVIYIKSGTGFTLSWYEITAYTDTNNVTIDRSAGSSATAGTGSVGGARALPSTNHYAIQPAGNTNWYKAGTYTLTASISVANDGNKSSPIRHIGYNTTRGDNPLEDNRPLIAAAAYTTDFDNYHLFKNLRITMTTTQGLRLDVGCGLFNCYGNNSSGTADRTPFTLSSGTNVNQRISGCEAESANGWAIIPGKYNDIVNCYFHDSKVGVKVFRDNVSIHNTIIDTITTRGVDFTNINAAFGSVIGCTIYNCTEAGIYNASTNSNPEVKFTILSTNGKGIHFDGTVSNHWGEVDYNAYNGNTTDVDGISKGANAVTADPEFTDAANGDFNVGSNMEVSYSLPGGLTSVTKTIGAAPRAPGGAGGGESSYVSIG